MPVRRIVFELGQSQASPIGDLKSWEDQKPWLAIRSANTNLGFLPQYSQGAYADEITLAGRFPGGPTIDQLGSKVVGQWQTASIRGKTVSAIKCATFYRPAYINSASAFATSYPGTAEISFLEPPTPSKFLTNHQAQPSQYREDITSVVGAVVTTSSSHTFVAGDLVAIGVPFGGVATIPTGIDTTAVYRVKASPAPTGTTFNIEKWPDAVDDPTRGAVSASGGSGDLVAFACELGTITRHRTRSTHTAAHGAPGSSSQGRLFISVYPPMVPPPVAGEYFDYPITLGDTSVFAHSKEGPMCFRTLFGGLSDAGASVAATNVRLRAPLVAAGTPQPIRVTCESQPIFVGRTLTFGVQIGFVTTANTSATLTFIGPQPFVNGDSIVLTDGGSLATAGFTAGTRYYVINRTATTVQLTTVQGATANIITATATTGPHQMDGKLPDGMSTTELYFVSRMASLEVPPVIPSVGIEIIDGPTGMFRSALVHGLVEYERVKLRFAAGASVPTGLVDGQDYFVRLVDHFRVNLSLTPGGAVITFTLPQTLNVTLERPEDLVSFYVSATPGGPELRAADNQDVFTGTYVRNVLFEGSFTGMRARCTAGPAANVGKSVALTNIEYTNAASIDVTLVNHDGEWPVTPTDGDTFAIEPQPVGGDLVPFSQWCEFLPWCPLEGRAQGQGDALSTTMSTNITSNELGQSGTVVGATQGAVGNILRFYSGGTLPNRIRPGDNYYITATSAGLAFFSATYDGDNFTPPEIVATCLVGSAQLSFSSPHGCFEDEPVSFFAIAGGDPPINIVEGTRYYATVVSPTVILLKATPGGSEFLIGDANDDRFVKMRFPGSTNVVSTATINHEGRANPYPPGFNYANQVSLPSLYQPYNGPAIGGSGGASSALTVCINMADYYGEPIYLSNQAYGGASLGVREVIPGNIIDGSATGIADLGGFGWFDVKHFLSWDIASKDGCYARFIDVLDGIKLALRRESLALGEEVTGQVELITWLQGEADATVKSQADRYGVNLRQFKRAVRQAIKDAGLFDGPAEQIPWVNPIPKSDFGLYAETVIAATEAEDERDPWSRTTIGGTDGGNPTLNDLYPENEDAVHWNGASMDLEGERIFQAWLSIKKTNTVEIDICNLALSHIGETAQVTSIFPPDGSAQAKACAQFYPQARDMVFESHDWAFLLKRRELVSKTNDRTVFEFAYEFPEDARDIVAIVPPDATSDDYAAIEVQYDSRRRPISNRKVSQDFLVEMNTKNVKTIYTNQDEAWVRYRSMTANPVEFSHLCRQAIAAQLAVFLVGPIVKGDQAMAMKASMIQLAQFYLGQARGHDADSNRDGDMRKIPSWIARR